MTDGISELRELHARVAELELAAVDIHGESGQNGKLGELRRRVDTLASKAWLLLAAFVGGIGAAAIKLIVVVRAFDAVESTANHSADHIKVLQAQVMTLQTALLVPRPWPASPAEGLK